MSYNPSIVKEVDGQNPFIRAYFWLWPINPSKLNTCYLFWGTVFAPLNFLLRVIAAPFYYSLRPVGRKIIEWEDNREYKPIDVQAEAKRKAKREERWEGILNLGAPVWRRIRWPLAFIGAGGIVFVLYLFVKALINDPSIAITLGILFGATLILLGIIIGIFYLLEETKVGKWLSNFADWVGQGYWSVKNRTCAKFVVK